MNEIIIREERQEDYRETELMTMRAFWNIHEPGCCEHLLVHKLRTAPEYVPELSRVAEVDGKIAGAIFYSRAVVQDGDRIHEVLTFGPLCVDPMAQHLGIGGRLLRETMQLAKEAGYPGICIFGEPDYYPKHGFVTCDRFGITDAEGNNFDAFMGYELQENGFAHIRGKFREAAVFEECDNEEEVEQFTKQFPFYPKLKLRCQWLHKERLGRICSVQKSCYLIQFWEAQVPAKLRGSFYQDGQTVPVVGDYVTFDYQPFGDSIIQEVCERSSLLKRPYPADHTGKNGTEQEMAANVEEAWIVTSLNDNYNVNRIVRYAAVIRQGNTAPVVVLTKADLCEDAVLREQEVKEVLPDTPVYTVSAATGTGMEALQEQMLPGKTIALLGSSGVGKSTLLNALAGKELMKTGGIREKDDRGRHTTTGRQMIVLPGGVTIIDTPGMRELGMCDVREGIEETFQDIVELQRQCRFRNCSHETEPGCQVKQAIRDGRLSEERYALFCSLQAENKRNTERVAVSQKRRQLKKRNIKK